MLAGWRSWFGAGFVLRSLRVRPRLKSLYFHEAKIRQHPCRTIMQHGPAGETQRVHYAIDNYGVRTNIFTKHAQPDFNTSSFGLESRESPTKFKNDLLSKKSLQYRVPMPTDIISFKREIIHFPEANNFRPSKLAVTLSDSNVSLNRKNSGIGQLTSKFSSGFSTKEALMQSIASNSSVGRKSINDSKFSVTHPPHQYFVRANLSNANINLQNSSSSHLPITIFTADLNNEKENITEFETGINVTIKEYFENVSSIHKNYSVAPSMTSKSINKNSTFPISSRSVDERQLTNSSTMEITSANSTRLYLDKDFNSSINITTYNSEIFEPAFASNQSLPTIQSNNSFVNYEYGEENSNASMETTPIIPQILYKNILPNEINSNNSGIQDEVYLSLLNSTLNGINMNESVKYNANNRTELDQFSEILLPVLEKNNQSLKGNETDAKRNNMLTTDETERTEIVTSITKFHPTESIETKSNNSSQGDHNNSSPSAENISTINRQPSECQMESVEIPPSNETSFNEAIDININKTSKDSIILTNKHTGNMELGNHNKQPVQQKFDNEIVSVDDANNPLFTNQLALTESTPELNNIFHRKSSEISQKNKTYFNKMKSSGDNASPMFDYIDNRNAGLNTDLEKKVRLYPKELNNTLKIKNASLKLWRGKSGVRIEPFGVNRAYQMIPVLQ
ncbi:uncharacterized protein TNCV_558751 [Trichonephila clavipes]|nr:uncharacterized protein TNCV_558751 [Trichonephila clavipes]